MLSADDLVWLKDNYPALRYDGHTIQGRINFDMSYDPKTGQYVYFPEAVDTLKPGVIHHMDDYLVRLTWVRNGLRYPVANELENKIKSVATDRNLSNNDLHLSGNGDLCLAAPQDLSIDFSEEFSLQLFIQRYLLPYLFLQTHFKESGEWAWDTSEHGLAGIFGWSHKHSDSASKERTLKEIGEHIQVDYATNILRKIRKDYYKGHMPCLCDSNNPPKRIRDCCPNAQLGLNEIRKELILVLLKRVGSWPVSAQLQSS
ncbi:MAG: hypothetical protein JWM52_618 [Candidatus Saccharibacteria bacterium]|nr:hypothetical protein [Candidatus Saccharibacteria bacterium]